MNLPFGITIGRTSPKVTPEERGRALLGGEIGAPGTQFYSGFLNDEEYLPELQGANAIKAYGRMRHDSMVKAMLQALTMPLRGAIPGFEPASDDPLDKHIALACEDAFFNMRGQLWDSFFRQLLNGKLTYGHAVFEPVWVDPEGKPNLVEADGEEVIAPYKLAPRLQKSIFRWHIDKYGSLLGIQQRVFVGGLEPGTEIHDGDTSAGTYGASGTWKFIDIAADRLFVSTLDQEGANFAGISVLRAAYKNWYYKDVHLRIQALAAERHGVGVPYAIVKQGIHEDEEAAVVAALASLHAHEKGYLLVSEAQLADYSKIGMNPIGIMNMGAAGTRQTNQSVEYHDRQMAVSILADFLTLGAGNVGSFSIHRDKRSMFYDATKGVQRPTEDDFNQQVVRRFVDLNWGRPKNGYPKFGLSGLESKDAGTIGAALGKLFEVGALTPTADTEQSLRDDLDLPALPTDEEGNPAYPKDLEPPAEPQPLPPPPPPLLPPAPAPGQQDPENPPPADAKMSERRWSRELRDVERLVNFAEIEDTLDDAVNDMVAAGSAAAHRVAERIAEGGKVTTALRDELADAFSGTLSALYARGATQVRQEFTQQTGGRRDNAVSEPPAPPGGDLDNPRGLRAMSINLAERLIARITTFFDRHKDDVDFDASVEMRDASDSALYSVANYSVAVPLNQGRSAAAKELSAQIKYAERSALLDGETCGPCADRDGKHYNIDTAEYDENEPPAGCKGGGNCRCVYVYVFADESGLSERPRVLAEARCQQCVDRGRPTGKLLGHNLPVGAKAYCSGCRQLVDVRE